MSAADDSNAPPAPGGDPLAPTELELLRRRVRVLEVGAWLERAMIALIVALMLPEGSGWWAVFIGVPVALLYAIYIFIERLGKKAPPPIP